MALTLEFTASVAGDKISGNVTASGVGTWPLSDTRGCSRKSGGQFQATDFVVQIQAATELPGMGCSCLHHSCMGPATSVLAGERPAGNGAYWREPRSTAAA